MVQFGTLCIITMPLFALDHYYSPLPQLPIVRERIEELCLDGGKVRLRTAQGLECIYKDYKAMHTNSGLIAGYQDNIGLIN